MIHVMSRGNSIVAGVVLIGILGTLSIALQATTPSTRTVAVLPESQGALTTTALSAAQQAAPKEIGCWGGYEYKVRKVGGNTQISCTPTPTNRCKVNWSGKESAAPNSLYTQERYNSAGAGECVKAINTNNAANSDSGFCPWSGASDCNLWHCFTPKGSKTETCIEIRNGWFSDEQGFSAEANEDFALRQLVDDAARKGPTAGESQKLLTALKADAGTSNGVAQAFNAALAGQDARIKDLQESYVKACGGSTTCTQMEADAFENALRDEDGKFEKIQQLNDDLKKVATFDSKTLNCINPPCPGPGNDGPSKGGNGGGGGGGDKTGGGGSGGGGGGGQQPPTTGFGQPAQQKPASSGSGSGAGASNPYQQCSPQYFCTNNTLYWGSQQQQQQSSYYPYYGSGCQNQIVQYCQYGCAQGNTACSQNPQNTGQTPVPTLTCGGNNTVLDVGATVPITFSCTNAASSAGSGFSTGGALSGSASAIIQKPPSGADVVSYGLTCTASNNQTASVRCDVGINVTSIVMVANPKQVSANASTTIGWVTRGMKECVVHVVDAVEDSALEAFNSENAENTAVSGIAVTPGLTDDTTFTLSCKTKTNQTKSANVTVKVE